MTNSEELERLRLENHALRDNRRSYEADKARLEDSLERFDVLVEELQTHVDVQAKQLAHYDAGEKHTKQLARMSGEAESLTRESRALREQIEVLDVAAASRIEMIALQRTELQKLRGAISAFVGKVGPK